MNAQVSWSSRQGLLRRRAGRLSSWTSCQNLPTILCDIRSWNYTTFPPGHFDMVWASPVCAEHSHALTTRPRRLLKDDALVLSALEIIARFNTLMWVVENPAAGLLKTRPFTERLPWVDVTYCKYGTPSRKQTRLWTNMRWRSREGLCRPGSRGALEGQCKRVSQSRKLLYSVLAALCDKIARAATAELAERLSIPD